MTTTETATVRPVPAGVRANLAAARADRELKGKDVVSAQLAVSKLREAAFRARIAAREAAEEVREARESFRSRSGGAKIDGVLDSEDARRDDARGSSCRRRQGRHCRAPNGRA